LSSLLSYFELSARKRLAALRLWFPVSIVTLLGGLLVVGYCVALFMPLVHIIRDLSAPGT
jgi:hypothetical protein